MVPEAPQASALTLGGAEAAFARGGNRLCFVDPRDPLRCIKTLRTDRSPAVKRREKALIKRLKPLSSFDDNLQESLVFQRIQARIGERAFTLIPRLHGFVNTELGRGLCCDLIRDDDGRIAISLKQYLWQRGLDPALQGALDRFAVAWRALGMPSRRLLLHNIVVQCEAGSATRLYVIDGLGWPDMLPLARYVPALARRKAGQRLDDLERAIHNLLGRRAREDDFGIHGWLTEASRQPLP